MTNRFKPSRPRRRPAAPRCIGAFALVFLPALAAGSAPSYDDEVLPILEKYCFDCHGDGTAKGELAFDSWKSAKEREEDLHAWKNVLSNVSLKVMPPPKRKDQPTDAERAVIERWIERVVFRYNPDEPDPGRVTIRRLNRQEYNNTVRDLLHVDFKPADDFPADDTGYGFDTIGDVLTLSPILLEKYMRAAEQVTASAIRTEDPPKPEQRYDARALGGDGDERGGDRVLSSAGKVALRHEFPRDGEYKIRVLAGAEQAGNELAKMTLTVLGKDLHTFEVKAPRGRPVSHERRVRMRKGKHEIGAKFINDFYDPKNRDPKRRDRNLYIRGIEIEGPLGGDTAGDPPPEFHRKLFERIKGSGPEKLEGARAALREFACRAYRRKVPEKEIDRLMRFVRIGAEGGGKYAIERGMQLACQAVLISPFFLYRAEVQPDPDNPDATYRIDEYALASRLSFFLWSSLPDDELFMHATRGTLRANLDKQVARMLRDPKAEALTKNFAGQWLQLRNLAVVEPDPVGFKSFDDKLRESMRRESEMLFEHVVGEDLPITELLDARYSFIDARLAKHYGIDGVQGDEFRKVSLEGTPRRGLLTHGSILTITSNPTRTSPVKRGKWILENILATPPPEAPPGVAPLDSQEELKGTLRQRLEQHREDPNCAACHAIMDPIGLAFEHFDAVGAWRDQEEGVDIDAGGELISGEKFGSHAELQDILSRAKRDDFLRCASEMMLTYALGRGLEFYDKPAVESVVNRLKDNDLRFYELVLGVVHSVPFQYRRGEGSRSYD